MDLFGRCSWRSMIPLLLLRLAQYPDDQTANLMVTGLITASGMHSPWWLILPKAPIHVPQKWHMGRSGVRRLTSADKRRVLIRTDCRNLTYSVSTTAFNLPNNYDEMFTDEFVFYVRRYFQTIFRHQRIFSDS